MLGPVSFPRSPLSCCASTLILLIPSFPLCPCSIQCGHIFCYECLNRIEPASSDPSPVCPLCRQPYDKHYIIKLHLDTDNPRPSSANQAEQEAKRLQGKMTNLINNGASEPAIRGLLDECQKFIHSQPRNLFSDLRLSHRVMAYLVDVRSDLFSQKQVCSDLNNQVEQLGKEKAELERLI
ncbi:hypothetical protein Agabi119p4_10840 [Agaricus bisporus var. burnettii]|uniref:RING-type domain-containing protein n=1 Tax=Agaricus bisporus var. burnettii TaxID=192524 RepID=A0A8H7EVI2_AGABI|nr:hypothetical protein Agabi119p4_10840 [Agaricus bisporus var. burnettii]